MSDPHPLEVTIETAIDGVHAEDFHRLSLDAFEPLQTLAAARQVLHRDEFMEDMQDPRVFKYVGWSSRRPIALATRPATWRRCRGSVRSTSACAIPSMPHREPSTTWASRWCTRRATSREL